MVIVLWNGKTLLNLWKYLLQDDDLRSQAVILSDWHECVIMPNEGQFRAEIDIALPNSCFL